ncbi:hypothetical protein M2138_001634 [Dysgonomonadaceae bacterium PH5-43]|nr:hypothetical protein [Dysgonomonadaceae bacterium PH5-43]
MDSLREELLSEIPIVQNWIFVAFLFCLFLSLPALSKGGRTISSMFQSLFKNDTKDSLFLESAKNELVSKILLILQSIILFSIIAYSVIKTHTYIEINEVNKLHSIILWLGLFGLSFIMTKLILYNIFNNIFFRKEDVAIWNETFSSILSLSGLILFIPTLIMFFEEKAYIYCLIFIVTYLIGSILLTFYKIYSTFFYRKGLLLYFILYLCTLEIMPLYWAYKAFSFLFISM